MKINFDTADYFNVRTLVWVLLALAAGIIIYHAGYVHGECAFKKKFRKHLQHRQQMMFNMHAPGAMPPDVMYMHGGAAMMPGMMVDGPRSGSMRVRAGEPMQGMRVMKFDGGDEKQLFLYELQ